MQEVVVGFSRNRGPFSWLIRYATDSGISHVYVKITDESGKVKVFQASGLKVNEESYESFLTHATVVAEIPVKISDEHAMFCEDFRKAALNKPYSVMQIVGFAWVLFWRRMAHVRVSNPFSNGSQAYICVEIGAIYANISNSEDLTPVDLYNILTGEVIGH